MKRLPAGDFWGLREGKLFFLQGKGQAGSEPADDGYNGDERKDQQKIEDPPCGGGSQNLGAQNPPDKSKDGDGQEKNGKTDLDGNRSHGLRQIIQPPGEIAGPDGQGGKKNPAPQAMPGCGLKGFDASNEIEKVKQRRGEHENDGEMDQHGMGMAAKGRETFQQPG